MGIRMGLVSRLVTSSTSIKDWYLLRDRIDMSPDYQRRPNLWSAEKRSLLIDTILNHYDIPKIYLADLNSRTGLSNERNKLFAVIDGKQRLETIFDFLEDKFELSKHVTAPGLEPTELAKLSFSRLSIWHPELAQRILDYELSVVTIVADSEDDIHRMFVRLNFGVSVNAAERRNARPGPVPVAVRQISEHPFFQQKTRFPKARGEDRNLAAKILLFESQGGLSDTKAARLDRFADEYAAPDKWEVVLALVDNVKIVLDRLSRVFGDSDPLLSSSGQIPVYYWFARNNWTNQPEELHEFWSYYDDQVKRQFRGETVDTRENINQLAEYYRLTRTVNDRDSINGRYMTLSERWAQWLRGR